GCDSDHIMFGSNHQAQLITERLRCHAALGVQMPRGRCLRGFLSNARQTRFDCLSKLWSTSNRDHTRDWALTGQICTDAGHRRYEGYRRATRSSQFGYGHTHDYTPCHRNNAQSLTSKAATAIERP